MTVPGKERKLKMAPFSKHTLITLISQETEVGSWAMNISPYPWFLIKVSFRGQADRLWTLS